MIYTSIQSTTVALPALYCCLAPELSPANLGNAATTLTVTSFQNSIAIDPHFSCSFTYKVPPANDVAYIGGNMIEGGWLPCSFGTTVPVTTNPGLIAFSSGDSLFGAPTGVVFGTLVVEYLMDFKGNE